MPAFRGLLAGSLRGDTLALSLFLTYPLTVHGPTEGTSLFFRGPGWWASFSRHVASARSFPSAVPHWEGSQGLSLLLLALLRWVKDLVVAFSLSFCPNGSPRYLTASQWKVGTVVLICYFIISLFCPLEMFLEFTEFDFTFMKHSGVFTVLCVNFVT